LGSEWNYGRMLPETYRSPDRDFEETGQFSFNSMSETVELHHIDCFLGRK
jgi:hypothetical protein